MVETKKNYSRETNKTLKI